MSKSRGRWIVRIAFLAIGLAMFPAGTQAADLKEGVEQLAVQLGKSVPEGRTLRVAVTDFPDLQGVTSDLGRYVAERLTTRLSAETRKFRVVERRRLGLVLAELKFSMSDLVDPTKAKQLGKMLGVEGLVTGSLSDLGNVVEVDARVIEIETNNVLPGVTVAISKDQVVAQLIAVGRTAPPSPGVAAAPGPSASRPSAPAAASSVTEALKGAAHSLSEQARLAQNDWSLAEGVLNEYNLLVERAKAALGMDPFIQATERVERQGSPRSTALLAGVLAQEFETYLTTLVAAKALRRTVVNIVEVADDAAGDWWLAESALLLYNAAARKSRKMFRDDPVMRTLREVPREGSASATAGKAARLARQLEALLAPHDRP